MEDLEAVFLLTDVEKAFTRAILSFYKDKLFLENVVLAQQERSLKPLLSKYKEESYFSLLGHYVTSLLFQLELLEYFTYNTAEATLVFVRSFFRRIEGAVQKRQLTTNNSQSLCCYMFVVSLQLVCMEYN